MASNIRTESTFELDNTDTGDIASDVYPERPLTSQQIFDAVEALCPEIKERADETRLAGKIPDDLMEKLRTAGLFRAAFPAKWGGPEMRLADQVRVIETIARHDASTAWASMILFDSGFFAGNFPDDIVRQVYPSMDSGTAVSQYPLGRADIVDGGYRVTGRFRFGSGSFNADVFICPCRVFENGEPKLTSKGVQEERLFFFPKNEVTVFDVWRMIGMQGTGSTDYAVDDSFCPAQRTWVFDENAIVEDRPPLSRHNQYLAVSQLGVILGLTEHILDILDETVATRISMKTEKQIKESYETQTGVPEARAMWGAARAYVYEYARETDDILFGNAELTHNHTGKLPMVSVGFARLCRIAVDIALEIVGTDAGQAARPWEPLYQDFRVASAHVLHRRPFYAESIRRRALEG